MAEHPQAAPGPGDGYAVALDGLRVETNAGVAIVDDVSLRLRTGEVLGLVGESGSGKTTTALALFGFTGSGARIARGTLTLSGHGEFDLRDRRALEALRGRFLSYVPQSPGTSLNPAMRIGVSLSQMQKHRDSAEGATAERGQPEEEARRVLETVGLPTDREFLRRFPHQLSGGQQQRICCAIALLSGSRLIVLDEPTTGLDVITQAALLDELRRLQRELSVSMVYISHDLAVVGELASTIAVMYAGRLVEAGPAQQILTDPTHPYTHGLLSSTPDHRVAALVQPMPGVAPSLADRTAGGCSFAPRCARVTQECRSATPELRVLAGGETSVRCLHPIDERFDVVHRQLPAHDRHRDEVLAVNRLGVVYTVRGEKVAAVEDVTFSLGKGECLAVVGESGSGKTTTARAVAGLQRYTGEVTVHGSPLACLAGQRSAEQRRLVQIVFQNPTLALNPREDVRRAITRSLAVCPSGSRRSVAELLELVRLPASLADSLPRELSGGERQRVSIARALACNPEVVICDEITSALDVSVQAAILTLLRNLRDELGVSLLFITHDLGVVANIASEVLVLQRGAVCEQGSARQVLDAPSAPYTQSLMKAAPSLNGAVASAAAE